MSKSLVLLYEALTELEELANSARAKKPFLYEGVEVSSWQVLLSEAEEDEGFFKKTTAAVKKVQKAAKSGISEADNLRSSLQATDPPMENSVSALTSAIADLEKNMPGDSFLSKISGIGGSMLGSLFGKQDDPVEKVTEIMADVQRFKGMIAKVVDNVLENVKEISPEDVVSDAADTAAEQDGAEGGALTDEQKEKYVKELREKLLAGTINDMLNSEDALYVSLRDSTGFDASVVAKALKDSTKPAKWFSGLKSLAGTFGIGLGGDLPLKKYGLTLKGVFDDITLVKISDLQDITSGLAASAGNTDALNQTAAGLQQLSGLEDQAQGIAQQSKPAATPKTDQPAAAPGDTTSQSAPPENKKKTSYLKILNAVPGIREPDAAADKFAALLAAGFTYIPSAGLRNLLTEKVLRYDDVVKALGDHLPEDEAEVPAAVKKLADEMKIELGTDFDIVGAPDELADLRAEIQALRQLIAAAPEDQQGEIRDSILSTLDSAGIDNIVVDDLLDPDVSIDDTLNQIPDEQVEDLDNAIPDSDPASIVPDEIQVADPDNTQADPDATPAPEPEPEKMPELKVGEMYEYTNSKGKTYPIKINGEIFKNDQGIMRIKILQPNKARTAWTKVESGVLVDKINLDKKFESDNEAFPPVAKKSTYADRDSAAPGSWWDDVPGFEQTKISGKDAPFGAKNQSGVIDDDSFATEKAAKEYAISERLARIAVAKMRGYILYETNNFKYSTNLTPREVIREFYKRGGKNEIVSGAYKSTANTSRWSLLAGLKNE